MKPPYFYDNSDIRISVDPTEIWKLGSQDIPGLVKQFTASIKSINDTWQSLKLSWNGTSAKEAQDFNDQWVAVMNKLYGPENAKAKDLKPGEGVLSKIALAVQNAAANLGGAEDDVVKMFNGMASGLNGKAKGDDNGQRFNVDGPVVQVNTPT